MTPSPSKSGRRGYHHGNLKEALVLAAKQLILEKGPHGFTLVEAAKIAGVSPGAPYRHFKDQNSLLAEVAFRGFELFIQRLDDAWSNGQPDWKTAFLNMGRAYIEFAYEEQAFYRAMFEADISRQNEEDLKQVSRQSFENLVSAAQFIKDSIPGETDISTETISYHIASMSHGAATLLKAREGVWDNLDPLDILHSNLAIYLRGLGIKF